jgi:hypothetical protein
MFVLYFSIPYIYKRCFPTYYAAKLRNVFDLRKRFRYFF